MKKSILIMLVFSSIIISQGEGALPFTTIQQSHILLGSGQIGTAIPNDDVLGFYLNPAILGYSSRYNHASISFMPNKTEWFYRSDANFHNLGINIGYDFKDSDLEIPLSIGFGFIQNKFSYGEYAITNDLNPNIIRMEESYDKFNCFSFGVGFEYYLYLSLGVSLKSFDSKFGSPPTQSSVREYKADGTMMDYGALLLFPISKLLLSKADLKIDNSTNIKPKTNFSIGYSLLNYGDEIYYVDEAQKDPLSRTSRLGYNLEIGFDLSTRNTSINVFTYSFGAEANDILIESNQGDPYDYQDIFGDISVSKNLINLEGDEKVIVHRGHIFKIFDTFILTSGRFNGRGYHSARETSGIGFSTSGIFNLINDLFKNSTIQYITKHLEFEYFQAWVEFSHGAETEFSGISVHYKTFAF